MVAGRSKKPHYSVYPQFTKEELVNLDRAAHVRDVSRAWLLSKLVKTIAGRPELFDEILKDGGKRRVNREPGQQTFSGSRAKAERALNGGKTLPTPGNVPASPGTAPSTVPENNPQGFVSSAWLREEG